MPVPERNTEAINILVTPTLKRRVETYSDEAGVSQAAAIRFLLDEALRTRGH